MIARLRKFAGMLLAFVPCVSALGADALQWNVAGDNVTAEISTWTVPDVLQRVAGLTGWQIFIDPEITNRVPAKFSGKQPGDALRSLLGRFNYALVPDPKGVSKLYVFRDSREQATRAIQAIEQTAAKPKSSRIPNELVVTLKPGEKIEDVARRLGAKVVGRSEGQNTYRLRFDDETTTESARASLGNDPSVEGIDNNYSVSRPELGVATGGEGAPLKLTPKASPDGKYIVIGLIDTAVQPAEGNFSQFLHSKTDPSAIKTGGEPTHGTLMAEAALRAIAANSGDKETTVRILPINVYPDGSEQTTTYDIAVGVYKAMEDGAHYLNLSLGGYGESTFLHDTIKSAVNQKIPVNAAAGNDGSTTAIYPAAWSESNSIGAIDPKTGQPAPYSNRSPTIDKWVPGSIVVTYNGQQYFVQGTSASTAIFTGMTASTPKK